MKETSNQRIRTAWFHSDEALGKAPWVDDSKIRTVAASGEWGQRPIRKEHKGILGMLGMTKS